MWQIELSERGGIDGGGGGHPGGGGPGGGRGTQVDVSSLPPFGLLNDVADVDDDGVGFLQTTPIRRRLAVSHGALGVNERLRPQTESVVRFVVKRSPEQDHFPTLTMESTALKTLQSLVVVVDVETPSALVNGGGGRSVLTSEEAKLTGELKG